MKGSWQDTPPYSAPDIHEIWDLERPPNIGMVTGEPSGVWVLDIDGPEGVASLQKLIGLNEKLPPTLRHKTGGGGYHLIFELPAGFRPKTDSNILGEDFPGIDVRGVGGQIVLPPSRSCKGDYSAENELEPNFAPDWLLALVPQVDERPAVELTEQDLAEYEGLTAPERTRVDAWLAGALRGVVGDLRGLPRPWKPGAGWDTGVFKSACRLFEIAQQPWNNLTYDTALSLLLEHAPTDDAWRKYDNRRKWESAVSSVGDKKIPRPTVREDDEPDYGGLFTAEHLAEARGEVVRDFPESPDDSGAPARQRRLKFRFDANRSWTEPDDKGKVQFRGKETALAIQDMRPLANGADGSFWAHDDGIWTPQPHVVADSLTLSLGDSYKPWMVREVSDHLASRIPQMVVEPTPEVINFRNGMLFWQENELRDWDPIIHSTIQLPHNYNPAAECPTFDQFLEESLPPAGVKLAWEILAVALYSGNPIQRAILLYGPPASGKSQFLDVVSGLLGQENVSRVTLQGLSARFNAAELYGRAANICADIDATKISETGAFKMIVAGDTVQAERKNRDPFNFRPFATQFFSANTIPGSDDRSGAWTRRFAVLHFPTVRPAEQRVLGFAQVMLQEAEGIIAKAIRILPEVILRGEYSLVQSDQADFERQTDYVLQFVEDEIVREDGAFTSSQDARWRYEFWCRDEGIEHPVNWKKVTQTLVTLGFKGNHQSRVDGTNRKGWLGFKLQHRETARVEEN